MISLIGITLKRLQLLDIVILITIYFSFVPRGFCQENLNKGQVDSTGSRYIHKIGGLFAREICYPDKVSFCSDGHEQPYRVLDLAFPYNGEAVQTDSIVFRPLRTATYYDLQNLGIDVQSPTVVDSLLRPACDTIDAFFMSKESRMFCRNKKRRSEASKFEYSVGFWRIEYLLVDSTNHYFPVLESSMKIYFELRKIQEAEIIRVLNSDCP